MRERERERVYRTIADSTCIICRARRSSDPYDKSYDHHLDRGKGKVRKGSKERLALTATTDQAYETMFDDDDIIGNQQTMPWFIDPNYLASNPKDVSLRLAQNTLYAAN